MILRIGFLKIIQETTKNEEIILQ